MTSSFKVTVRPPSPNNTKILIALGYKGIDAEIDAVSGMEPETIAKLVKISGQPLTPILEHNGVVIYDSGAILRYLDANCEGPRLFSADKVEMKAIEEWEAYHKSGIGAAMGPAFGVFFGGIDASKEKESVEASNAALHEASLKVEEQLAAQAKNGSEWLVGDTMTAADILVASVMVLAAFPDGMAGANPLWKWFGERLTLGEGRDLCRAHIARVHAYLPTTATA
ncbi:MAG: glutathione S-transferase [Planctomycetota bacterium]|jgi:glutathione S-transferase